MVPFPLTLPEAWGIFLWYLLWQPGRASGGKSHNIMGFPLIGTSLSFCPHRAFSSFSITVHVFLPGQGRKYSSFSGQKVMRSPWIMLCFHIQLFDKSFPGDFLDKATHVSRMNVHLFFFLIATQEFNWDLDERNSLQTIASDCKTGLCQAIPSFLSGTQVNLSKC